MTTPQDQVTAILAAVAQARVQLTIIAQQANALALAWPAPAPIPPPVPPAGGTVLAELIKSVNGTPHEGAIPGVGPGWDWYAHGVIQSQVGTRKASSGWASFQECLPNYGGLSVETRNWQHWALGPAVGGAAWTKLTTSIYGSQVHPQPPHEGGDTGPLVEELVKDAGGATIARTTMPKHGVGSQWFSPQCTLPSGCVGVITAFEVRLPVGQTASLLVAAGADYWPVAGSSSGNGGACVGRFVKPTSAWRWVCASSIPEAVLRATPPPL